MPDMYADEGCSIEEPSEQELESHKADLAFRRMNLLSEMAQVQRRNIELSMTLYTYQTSKGKTDEPSFPAELRQRALETIYEGYRHLGLIDQEIAKLR